MRKILVTGGAGFIGRELSREILSTNSNSSVMILDSFTSSNGNGTLLENKTDNENLQIIKVDLVNDTGLLDKLIQECDQVFHLAANVKVDVGASDTSIDFRNNIVATHNLLEAMRKSTRCKQIIFTSSSTVYGEPSVIPTPENYGPLIPISLYGSSKLACEALISGYCNSFSMSSVILRLANVIGPHSSHGVIYDFVKKLSHNPLELTIRGNGEQQKSYLHIEDCIRAFSVASQKLEQLTSASVEVYNVGSSDWIMVTEIADIVIRSLRLEDVKIVFTNGHDGGRGWAGDVREMLLDCARLGNEGWRADLNSRDSVLRTIMDICRKPASQSYEIHR